MRNRRYLLDGKPVLLVRSYLPASLAAGSPDHGARRRPRRDLRAVADLGHPPAGSGKTCAPGCPNPVKPPPSACPPAPRSWRSSGPPTPMTGRPSKSAR